MRKCSYGVGHFKAITAKAIDEILRELAHPSGRTVIFTVRPTPKDSHSAELNSVCYFSHECLDELIEI